jgi:hypothetical protein
VSPYPQGEHGTWQRKVDDRINVYWHKIRVWPKPRRFRANLRMIPKWQARHRHRYQDSVARQSTSRTGTLDLFCAVHLPVTAPAIRLLVVVVPLWLMLWLLASARACVCGCACACHENSQESSALRSREAKAERFRAAKSQNHYLCLPVDHGSNSKTYYPQNTTTHACCSYRA